MGDKNGLVSFEIFSDGAMLYELPSDQLNNYISFFAFKTITQDSLIQNEIIDGTTKETKKERDLHSLAQDFLKAKNYVKASENFHKLLKIDSKSIEAWYGLGICYQNMNLLFDAIRYYRKALELSPKDQNILYSLGSAHYNMNEFKEASEFFRKVTELNPVLADAWTWAGMSHVMLNDYESAIPFLERATELNPNDPRIWYSIGQSYGMNINSNLSDAKVIDLKYKVLRCYEKAEQKGIKKYLEKEIYHQFSNQMQNLLNELTKS
jgi:tetratricopeptide (TPR) repeat protein